jgi:hypothetical protein
VAVPLAAAPSITPHQPIKRSEPMSPHTRHPHERRRTRATPRRTHSYLILYGEPSRDLARRPNRRARTARSLTRLIPTAIWGVAALWCALVWTGVYLAAGGPVTL